MVKSLGQKLWILTLGIGLGSAIGVVISSSFGFEKADASRFVGSLLGSLIAVSGAVALHYLKESEGKNDRRRHLKVLLEITKGFVPLTLKDLHSNNEPSVALKTFGDQYKRALRFAEKYEFDDYAISEAYSQLVNLDEKIFQLSDSDLSDERWIKIVTEYLDIYGKCTETAARNLSRADGIMKVLS